MYVQYLELVRKTVHSMHGTSTFTPSILSAVTYNQNITEMQTYSSKYMFDLCGVCAACSWNFAGKLQTQVLAVKDKYFCVKRYSKFLCLI